VQKCSNYYFWRFFYCVGRAAAIFRFAQ